MHDHNLDPKYPSLNSIPNSYSKNGIGRMEWNGMIEWMDVNVSGILLLL